MGAILCRGVSNLHAVNGMLTVVQYRDEILEQDLKQFYENAYRNERFLFQQDLCPIHTANLTKSWFNDNNIDLLDWASFSPDMNPMENIWGDMKRELSHMHHITNSEQLRNELQLLWAKYSNEKQYVITNAFISMPRRIKQLKDNGGSFTKY